MNALKPKFALICVFFVLFVTALPANADYDEFVRQTLEQAKQDCISKGWVFEQIGNGSSCSPPAATGQAIGQEAGAGQRLSPTVNERGDIGIYQRGSGANGVPQPDTLPPNDDPRCESYARQAVQDFQVMNNRPECRLGVGPRWQPNYRNHYNWCLTAPDIALTNESRERDNHLRRCGARVSFD